MGIAPSVAGAQGMFMRLQHALQKAWGRQVLLSTAVQDELSAWRQLVQELAARLTHLQNMDPFHLTWEGSTDASVSGMSGVCQDPEGQWFIWRHPFYVATQARLVTDTNHTGDVTTNDLELAALLAQVQLFTPRWTPKCTSTQPWTTQQNKGGLTKGVLAWQ